MFLHFFLCLCCVWLLELRFSTWDLNHLFYFRLNFKCLKITVGREALWMELVMNPLICLSERKGECINTWYYWVRINVRREALWILRSMIHLIWWYWARISWLLNTFASCWHSKAFDWCSASYHVFHISND